MFTKNTLFAGVAECRRLTEAYLEVLKLAQEKYERLEMPSQAEIKKNMQNVQAATLVAAARLMLTVGLGKVCPNVMVVLTEGDAAAVMAERPPEGQDGSIMNLAGEGIEELLKKLKDEFGAGK